MYVTCYNLIIKKKLKTFLRQNFLDVAILWKPRFVSSFIDSINYKTPSNINHVSESTINVVFATEEVPFHEFQSEQMMIVQAARTAPN